MANDDEPLPVTFEAALEEVTEYRQSFDLRWKADRRAIDRWHAAHPGRENTWPDHADMVVWLLEQFDAKESELQAVRSELQEVRRELRRMYQRCPD